MNGGDTVVMFRPTGPNELALVRDSGYRRWPPRLPDQPIFYPVTQGWVAADSGDVSRVTGRAARRLVDYVADNAARFV